MRHYFLSNRLQSDGEIGTVTGLEPPLVGTSFPFFFMLTLTSFTLADNPPKPPLWHQATKPLQRRCRTTRVIVSGSEDGTVKIWNSGTYHVENTLSYALECAWCARCAALRKDANEVAVVGLDEGVVVIKVCTYKLFP